MLKAEESSAGKEIKTRKQNPRGMNPRLNIWWAICDMSENTQKYFVWHIKKHEEEKLIDGFWNITCLKGKRTAHVSFCFSFLWDFTCSCWGYVPPYFLVTHARKDILHHRHERRKFMGGYEVYIVHCLLSSKRGRWNFGCNCYHFFRGWISTWKRWRAVLSFQEWYSAGRLV